MKRYSFISSEVLDYGQSRNIVDVLDDNVRISVRHFVLEYNSGVRAVFETNKIFAGVLIDELRLANLHREVYGRHVKFLRKGARREKIDLRVRVSGDELLKRFPVVCERMILEF